MSSFSRVIARPTANAKQSAPNVVVAEPTCLNGAAQHTDPSHLSPDMDLPLLEQTSVSVKPVAREGDYQLRPWDHSSYSGDSVKPFPRLFTLGRTASLRSIPSLCSDDSFAESMRSSSPVSPHSPLPTACSTMAVLGSPGHLSSFAEEYDRPEAHVDFVRRKLAENWNLRRQARMRDGDYRDTDIEKDYSLSGARVAPGPAYTPLPRAVPTNMYEQSLLSAAAASLPRPTSRLSKRVKTPPQLNVAAIHAHAMLAKLLGKQYEVEIGNVDGSIISESGNEADDESQHSSPEDATQERGGTRESCSAQPTVTSRADGCAVALGGGETRMKKSYAAVLAASP
ncbi:hypothetical protein FKP32DRAFT_1282751 [Trametes sanguinea]|nr:hypothetical protein FKP32DRAFT_1282751 [Trametes sanguinea]